MANSNWALEHYRTTGCTLYGNAHAVAIDPEGGHHVVRELSEEYAGQGERFWCAGYVRRSAAAAIDALWDAWDVETPWDNSYERAERSFTERFDF